MASSQVLEEVKKAMIEYYSVLSRMAHFPPNSLCIPPPEGWPDIDREGLRGLGCSDEAITFASHLPYMDPCVNSPRAWITLGAQAVALHRGQKWEERMLYTPAEGLSIFPPPMPPHLIQIADRSNGERYAPMLCVDTQEGTIIVMRWDGSKYKPGITWESYENIPEDEQWAAYLAIPARDFFSRETLRLLRLTYVTIPPSKRFSHSMPLWYERILESQEDELAAIDDEWEADHEDDSTYEDEQTLDSDLEDLQIESDSEGFVVIDEDVDEDEEMTVDPEEVEALRAEAETMEFDGPPLEGRPRLPQSLYPEYHRPKAQARVQRAYEIYKCNAWPYEYFNEEQCRAEMLEFAHDLEAEEERERQEERAKRPKTKEEWYEDRRQRKKAMDLKHGKPWDFEKEKTQTAQEWYEEFERSKKQAAAPGIEVGR